MEQVLIFGTILAYGAGCVGLGIWLSRRADTKYRKTIQNSYAKLISEQRELANSDPQKAHIKGWRDGYNQALEDTYIQVKNRLGEP